ncbi:ribonuclease H2, subunit C [Bisporella sp. PMI_857]|nr:ribonuclease H2, subunit C [Bisporella sp. PMI_857]
MLAFQKSESHKGKCTPNILPCRINHTGPVDTSKRYWNPTARDGKQTAYFRGRKLHGRSIAVPPGYRGVVATKSDKILPKSKIEVEAEEEDEGKEEETKIMEEIGTWDEMVVWGHEALADEGDPYVRGVEEWVAFSKALHGFGEGDEGEEKK